MNKNDIRVFKLSTGEDIVAEVVEENLNSIYVANPLQVKRIPNLDENRMDVYFVVWGEFNENEEPIYLNPRHVVSYYWLNDEYTNKLKAFMDSGPDAKYSMSIN